MAAIDRDDEVGKKAFALIRARLAEYPDLTIVETDTEIEVKGDSNGFDVSIRDDLWQATIQAESWHNHFEDPNEAADCFMWLLTPNYRVRTRYRRNSISSVDVQRRESSGEWIGISSFAPLIQWPFGSVREEFKSNSLILREPPAAS